MNVTWQPSKTWRGEARSQLPDSAFAFPKERKEPLTDAVHVRDAVVRFNQVDGANVREREQAWANIRAAAKYYGIATD
ncbi:MAG TPA: DUF6582 domain-containing protein [Candidatus Baltobacteraceae bacterium]|nr:DUF6582 domain-containing protein [Candidatus Baltobacteraceae bacterium]